MKTIRLSRRSSALLVVLPLWAMLFASPGTAAAQDSTWVARDPVWLRTGASLLRSATDSTLWNPVALDTSRWNPVVLDSALWNPVALDTLRLAQRVVWSEAEIGLRSAAEPALENVRLTIQLIQANGFEDPDPAIGDVVEQLAELFRFEGYRLMAEATLVTELPVDGYPGTNLSQRIASRQFGDTPSDVFLLEVVVEPTREPGVPRFRLSLYDEAGGHLLDVLSVAFTARDGQTVVVGSSKYDPSKPTLIVAFRMERIEG